VFVNRERELATLEAAYASQTAELYILYGRRRVGKTELLRQFCQGKRHLFFIADLGTEANGLADFTRQMSFAIFGRVDALGPFPSWDSALEFVAQQAQDERFVVVIDEFTYLGQVNPAVPSIFQRVWDTKLQQSRVMLVLCGSYVGMMEKQTLSYRAPLYGRRTAQWQLAPLAFANISPFFPHYSTEDRIRAYAVLGGIPAYLRQFDGQRSLLHNIEHRLLMAGTYLHEEPRLLLLQELSEAGRYFAILEAIANKRTRLNEIAQTAGLPAPSLPFYLGTLRELGLVERQVPIAEPHAQRSKRGSYRIADNYFRFWFHYVYPNRSTLGRGEVAAARKQVESTLDEFVSPVFEEICREQLWRLSRNDRLGFAPREVGRWWTDDGAAEIDIVAVGEGTILLGECKWSKTPIDTDVLNSLIGKAQLLRGRESGRRLGLTQIRYALFSRSGFTPRLVARAEAEGVLLCGLANLE